jgi:hypothetical protein
MDTVKRIISLCFLFLLSITSSARTQPLVQDSVTIRDKVIVEAKEGGYQLISPEQLKEGYLKDSASFSLVDVRQEWSYQMQHMKGSLHIDFAPTWWNQYSPTMRSEMKNILGPDKDKKVVFY